MIRVLYVFFIFKYSKHKHETRKVIPNNFKMSQTLTFASLYTIIRLIERSYQLDTKQKKKRKKQRTLTTLIIITFNTMELNTYLSFRITLFNKQKKNKNNTW
ncbi:hypothetical protein MEM_02918 [Candida albicans L26]|nr:hypothetical protein MEM_02918 [Candida albicans L26]